MLSNHSSYRFLIRILNCSLGRLIPNLSVKKIYFLVASVVLAVLVGCSEDEFRSLSRGSELSEIQEGEPVPRELTAEEKMHLAQFNSPRLESFQRAERLQSLVRGKYSHLDPHHEIPQQLLDEAILYYDQNEKLIINKKYLTIVNFSVLSAAARLFVVDMVTGAVEKLHVAHGSGSDSDDDGLAERFSNVPNSRMSSLGFYLTAESYVGANGYSLRIDGLSLTNSKVRERAIVIHGSNKVFNTNDKPGMSSGCFSIPMSEKDRIISALKEGSLLYANVLH